MLGKIGEPYGKIRGITTRDRCVGMVSKCHGYVGNELPPFFLCRLLVVEERDPRDPITLSDDDWGVHSPPKRKVFRFHYHSHKVSQDP